MRTINRSQFILASIALLAAAALAHVLTPRELMARTSASLNLETAIPKQFGRWTLLPSLAPVTPADPDGYVEADEKSARIYSQEVGRSYTDGNGNIVMLMVAYGPVQNFRLKAHRPEMCYTAAGFRVSKKIDAKVNYSTQARPLKVARLIAERESRYEPISYWMRVGNDITTGVVDRQLARLKYGLKGLIPDGALMRVSTIGLPKEASYKVQDEFIHDLLAAIAPQESQVLYRDLNRCAVVHECEDLTLQRQTQIMLRAALRFGLALLLVLPAFPSHAENPEDDSLRIYAVNIHQTPMQTWGPGYGIYLGKGLFITAAHVAGRTWWTRPKVTIAGQEYPTRVVKEGSLEETDLTLLAVDENLLPVWLRLRRNQLCKAFPIPSEDVVTVVPEGIARSRVLAPERLPLSVRKFNSVIADVAKTGNSGSGVFDVQSKCLLGIMSRKISQSWTKRGTNQTVTRDIAKYFVPSTTIREFIPPDTSF